MSALEKLPSLRLSAYRGYPDKATVLDQYQEGRPIQQDSRCQCRTDIYTVKIATSRVTTRALILQQVGLV